MARGQRPRPAGHTTLELVVAVSVFGLAVAALGGFHATVAGLVRQQERRLDAQQSARRALERIVEELRWAEAILPDPGCSGGLCGDRVRARVPEGNAYRRDQTYDVTFQYNPRQQEVERRVGLGVNNLASGIRRAVFAYLDAAGAPATAAADVVRVRVTVETRADSGSPVVLESEVGLRNRRLPPATAPSTLAPVRPTPGRVFKPLGPSPTPSSSPRAWPSPRAPSRRV